jgi:DNA-binding transcriptional MerR regulator
VEGQGSHQPHQFLLRQFIRKRICEYVEIRCTRKSIFGLMYIELPEKRYYGIGEVARAFDVNTSLIRFWEKEFDALKPKKNAKGNRKFTPQDIKNLQLIYHLVKERGFTLEGAKIHLKENRKKTLDNFEIIEKLERVKAELNKIKEQL